jgi:hypothetical protein
MDLRGRPRRATGHLTVRLPRDRRQKRPVMARLCPKRTGRVSPLCAGTSGLNFRGNG